MIGSTGAGNGVMSETNSEEIRALLMQIKKLTDDASFFAYIVDVALEALNDRDDHAGHETDHS
jgi:hypothetical protein